LHDGPLMPAEHWSGSVQAGAATSAAADRHGRRTGRKAAQTCREAAAHIQTRDRQSNALVGAKHLQRLLSEISMVHIAWQLVQAANGLWQCASEHQWMNNVTTRYGIEFGNLLSKGNHVSLFRRQRRVGRPTFRPTSQKHSIRTRGLSRRGSTSESRLPNRPLRTWRNRRLLKSAFALSAPEQSALRCRSPWECLTCNHREPRRSSGSSIAQASTRRRRARCWLDAPSGFWNDRNVLMPTIDEEALAGERVGTRRLSRVVRALAARARFIGLTRGQFAGQRRCKRSRSTGHLVLQAQCRLHACIRW